MPELFVGIFCLFFGVITFLCYDYPGVRGNSVAIVMMGLSIILDSAGFEKAGSLIFLLSIILLFVFMLRWSHLSEISADIKTAHQELDSIMEERKQH